MKGIKYTMKKLLMMALAAGMSLFASAAALPSVGNGTEPNKWTSNVDGVISAAQKTGYPIFLCMINDTSTGVGCSHCWEFVINTLNNSEWKRIVSEYKFYMVMINNGGADMFSDYFVGQYYRFGGAELGGGLPLVRVFSADGQKGSKIWSQATCEGPRFWTLIEPEIAKLSVFNTKIELSSQSATTALAHDATWTGQVTRSGSSGATGTVAITLTGDNASDYTVEPATLTWGTSDGTKTFTVKRTAEPSGIVSDSLTVKIAASGFNGTTINYGTQEIALTFKDTRVGKTLEEFGAATAGLDGLSSSDAVWFVPAKADGNVIETITASSATLVWKATVGGVLTVSPNAGSVAVSGSAGTFELDNGEETTIGVKVGDTVTFAVGGEPESADEEPAAETYGFGKFSFKPLKVTLSAPADGDDISYAELIADKTLADFTWGCDAANAVYEVYATQEGASKVFSGTPLYEGDGTTMNGVDAGFVTLETAMGDCWWGVKAKSEDAAEHGTAVASATAAFSISAVAAFPADIPKAITAYLKAGTSYDFSAETSADGAKYSAKGLPSGMSIDSATGEITGTPKSVGTYTATISAKNAYGTATTDVKITVAKFPAAAKGNYCGVLFNSAGRMTGSLTARVSANGKWSGTVVAGLNKTKVKGTVWYDEKSVMHFASDKLPLDMVDGTSVLAGSWNGGTLYAKKVAKTIASSWAGYWNGAIAMSGEDECVGYLSAKVTVKAKAAISGKLNATKRVAATGTMLVLDSAFVAEYLPMWDEGSDAAFMYSYKSTAGRTFNGGIVIYGNGGIDGLFYLNGVSSSIAAGGKWNTGAVARFAGKTLATSDGVSFGVNATSARLTAKAEGAVGATKVKLTSAKKTGIFKGSFTNAAGGRCKYEGALFVDGSDVFGAGAGCVGKTGEFAVTIE